MSEQNIQENLPFWQVQGLKSFCKAKGDWLNFEKIHLSFVSHEGKPTCKQVMSIEGAIKIHGKDGALFLSDMILSGVAKKIADSNRAAVQQGEYAKPIFESMGGTSAARSKDGKCMFRNFSVSPGLKSDYVFTMVTCAGTENSTGGIQAVSGAKRDTIHVSLSSGDLFDFARSVQIEYTAFRTLCLSKGSRPANTLSTPVQGNQPQTPEVTQPQSVSANLPVLRRVCVIVDTSGTFNLGIPIVTTSEKAILVIQEATKAVLKNEKRFVAEAESYRNAVDFCSHNEKGTVSVLYSGKTETQASCAVVISIVDIQ